MQIYVYDEIYSHFSPSPPHYARTERALAQIVPYPTPSSSAAIEFAPASLLHLRLSKAPKP